MTTSAAQNTISELTRFETRMLLADMAKTGYLNPSRTGPMGSKGYAKLLTGRRARRAQERRDVKVLKKLGITTLQAPKAGTL